MYVYREERRWNIKLCCSVFYNNCTLFGATLFYVTSKEFSTYIMYRPSRKILEEKNLYTRKFVKKVPEKCSQNFFCPQTPFWLLKIVTDSHTSLLTAIVSGWQLSKLKLCNSVPILDNYEHISVVYVTLQRMI